MYLNLPTVKYRCSQGDMIQVFWATVYKTVRPMLSDCCLSVCPMCNVGVLWPNGWMDQDETWHGGRPGVTGPSFRRAEFSSTHICKFILQTM